MATLEAEGRDLGSYCPGNWCRWNAQTEKKESAWFWPLNWKSEWQTLTLWLYSLIKVSLFWPYYGSLKGFQSNPCRLAATKSADAFDVQGTVVHQYLSFQTTVFCKYFDQAEKLIVVMLYDIFNFSKCYFTVHLEVMSSFYVPCLIYLQVVCACL